MSVIFAENFQRYTGAEDPSFIDVWGGPNGISRSLELNGAAGFLYDNRNPGNNLPTKNISGSSVFRAAFLCTYEALNPVTILACGSGDKPFQSTEDQCNIMIEKRDSGEVRFMYSIHGPSGSYNDIKTLNIDTGFFIQEDVEYWMECEIDHSSPTASVKIIMNGASILDTTYDRDDVKGKTSDPLLSFEWVSLPGRKTKYRNLVVWDDGIGGLDFFPAGPLEVESLSASDASLASPADDQTSVQITDGTYTQYDVADLADPSQTIYATFAEVRSMSSSGTEPAKIGVKSEVGAAIQEWQTQTSPGLPGKLDVFKITDGATVADVTGAKISLKKAQ